MYTQCPACKTAFRVTAQILQRAAGRVRCGGCRNAFNALEYLSEDMPKEGPGTRVAADRPAVLHEAKRRQLLETLDELAGPEEVRIEDTGVEWRVLEENAEEEESPPETSATGALRWYLEEPDGESRRRAPDPGRARGASPDEVMRYDDNTPLPDDFADDEPRHEHPLRRQEDRMQLETAHFDELQVDLALGEPDDWVDLLDEVDAGDAGSVPDEAIALEVEEELAAIHSELSGRHRVAGDRGSAAGKAEIADNGVAGDDDEEPPVAGGDADAMPEEPDDESPAPTETTGEFEARIAAARAALDAGDFGAPEEPATSGEFRFSLVEDRPDPEEPPLGGGADTPGPAAASGDGMPAGAVAAGDEPGPERSGEAPAGPDVAEDARKAAAHEDVSATIARHFGLAFDASPDSVETIIMEGEFVRGALEEEALRSAVPQPPVIIDEVPTLVDTYAMRRGRKRGRRWSDPPRPGTIAAVAALFLLLVGQLMHASRQNLSTYGAFNRTIGPVYRLLGKPVTPEWDVKGWQFEATRGATDENGDRLTIVSTIANRSARALPYPLVHVSLTDRWEEIIGSRVLEPNEYLAGDPDPSRPVAPGEDFRAVIAIDAPAENATGFKLNVCYRVGPGRVRCATEDFRE